MTTVQRAATTVLPIRDFPADLKAELVARADSEGSNFNAVAVRILAAAFGVPYDPTDRRTASDPAKTYVKLAYPTRLDDRIEEERQRRRRRGERGLSKKDIVLERLRAALA